MRKILMNIIIVAVAILSSCISKRDGICGTYYCNIDSLLDRYLLELRPDSMYIMTFYDFSEFGIWYQCNDKISLSSQFTIYSETVTQLKVAKDMSRVFPDTLIVADNKLWMKYRKDTYELTKTDLIKRYINPAMSDKVIEISEDNNKGKRIYYEKKNKYDKIKNAN